jgi:DNA adenine methylase
MLKQAAPQTQESCDSGSDRCNPLVQPFLKWAGGKRQLIASIKAHIPQHFTQYYEPFIGAGALLFALQVPDSTINDTNGELINCYRVIKDSPAELLELCQQHELHNSKEYFYRLRSLDRAADFAQMSAIDRAARIIYLNKTCFNGLFRVNSQGQFNVPYGDAAKPVIADPEVIMAVSDFLNQKNVQICCGDFAQAVATAQAGAFIYFDPPYHPVSDTASFTGYSANGFAVSEQERLKRVCDELVDRGCQVLISNSNASFIRELYDDPRYAIAEVTATRAINAVGGKRGRVGELLIYNKQ